MFADMSSLGYLGSYFHLISPFVSYACKNSLSMSDENTNRQIETEVDVFCTKVHWTMCKYFAKFMFILHLGILKKGSCDFFELGTYFKGYPLHDFVLWLYESNECLLSFTLGTGFTGVFQKVCQSPVTLCGSFAFFTKTLLVLALTHFDNLDRREELLWVRKWKKNEKLRRLLD